MEVSGPPSVAWRTKSEHIRTTSRKRKRFSKPRTTHCQERRHCRRDGAMHQRAHRRRREETLVDREPDERITSPRGGHSATPHEAASPRRSDQDVCCSASTTAVATTTSLAITGAGPTVTEVDDQDGDRLDFLGCHNPHDGPPSGGTGQVTTKPPRAPKHMTTGKRY